MNHPDVSGVLPETSDALTRALTGCLLGTAVGDALGLPYEGLSPRRARKLLGPPDRHRFVFGRGMISDDTEHTCLVAQCLIECPADPAAFQRALARRLRYWLLGLPAGIGIATLKAIIRLWLGFSPERSGVFSAGNGPAMRAAILGVAISDPEQLRAFVRASTRLTHTDPKAEYGAFAVALAAQQQSRSETSPLDYLERLKSLLGSAADELLQLISGVVDSVAAGQSTVDYARTISHSKGVTGYVYQSVPVALHAWLSHPRDYRAAITACVECGGDTDTVAAIAGGILGAAGPDMVPSEWLAGLCEWPRTVDWMQRLAAQLAQVMAADDQQGVRPLRVSGPAVCLRNACFLILVLAHGFRRLMPPY